MINHNTFTLSISKVDGAVFEGEAFSVNVPGVEGEMTILPHHSPLISPLRHGVVRIKTKEGQNEIETDGGTIEVSDNYVTILL